MATRVEVGDLYRGSRLRLQELFEGLDDEQWHRPVPACPGWDVFDVAAHLVGLVEDSGAGRLAGPPGPEQTAEEVQRHRDAEPAELVARWDELAGPFESVVSEHSIWPAFFDVLSHEHDVHGALGTTGGRDGADVALAAKLMVRSADLGRPFVVRTGTRELTSAVAGEDPLVLAADDFEVFRVRLGRRSRPQVLAMDWSEDPAEVVDRLFVFGPSEVDILE